MSTKEIKVSCKTDGCKNPVTRVHYSSEGKPTAVYCDADFKKEEETLKKIGGKIRYIKQTESKEVPKEAQKEALKKVEPKKNKKESLKPVTSKDVFEVSNSFEVLSSEDEKTTPKSENSTKNTQKKKASWADLSEEDEKEEAEKKKSAAIRLKEKNLRTSDEMCKFGAACKFFDCPKGHRNDPEGKHIRRLCPYNCSDIVGADGRKRNRCKMVVMRGWALAMQKKVDAGNASEDEQALCFQILNGDADKTYKKHMKMYLHNRELNHNRCRMDATTGCTEKDCEFMHASQLIRDDELSTDQVDE